MIKLKMSGQFLVILLASIIWLPLPAAPSGDSDISAHPHCPICGMDRQKFAHSRMLIIYEDGSRFGACSLHCVALELAYYPGKTPAEIQVADYYSHQLVNAEKAVWVLGGRKMGVMTANAKWAFADEKDAQRFIAAYGGEKIDFETAISETYCGMYKDTKMIRKKRKQKQMKKDPAKGKQ